MIGEITAHEQKNKGSHHPTEFTTDRALQSFKDHFYFFSYEMGLISDDQVKQQMNQKRWFQLEEIPVSDPFQSATEKPVFPAVNPFGGSVNHI